MKRADFMTEAQKRAMGKLPRTHQHCLDAVKVARPGKTAKDRASKRRQEA